MPSGVSSKMVELTLWADLVFKLQCSSVCVCSITETLLHSGLVEECFANIGIPLEDFRFCCFHNFVMRQKNTFFFGVFANRMRDLVGEGSAALAVNVNDW